MTNSSSFGVPGDGNFVTRRLVVGRTVREGGDGDERGDPLAASTRSGLATGEGIPYKALADGDKRRREDAAPATETRAAEETVTVSGGGNHEVSEPWRQGMGSAIDKGTGALLGGSEHKDKAKCMVCGRLAAGGLDIRGRRICPRCEKILCTVDPSNPRYRYYMRVLSGLWQGPDFRPPGKDCGINSEE